ncbi:MAG: hypothetical protein KC486_10070 [Myxococcales bacterium]|nr:hypothetical protein [Myxococcales bacterium]
MQPNAPSHPALRRLIPVGFALAALSAVLHFALRLVLLRALEGDLSATTEGDLLRLLSDGGIALHLLGWLAILVGVYRLRELAPRALIQGALALWALSLVFDVGIDALVRAAVDDAPLFALGVSAFIAEVLGSIAAIRFHSVRGAPAGRVLVAAALVGLRAVAWALLTLGDGVGSLGTLWPLLRCAEFVALALLPWAATLESPAPADAEVDVGAERERADATRNDLVFGGIALAIGVFLTAGTFAAGGVGGRVILAWGPVVYGIVRIFRGLTRSARP